MDYEKKYKEALGWMQSLYDDMHGATKEDAEHYFPELRESEDERIRKELIEYFNVYPKDYFGELKKSHILAWLEKQGGNHTPININKMVVEYSQTKDGDFGLPVNCQIRAYRQGINDTISILNLEKQGEKKPADMVEPKDYSSIDPHFFKTDWGEGDEMLCQCLIEDQEEALDDVCNDKCGHSEIISDLKEMYRERIDWLKSLKERMEGE